MHPRSAKCALRYRTSAREETNVLRGKDVRSVYHVNALRTVVGFENEFFASKQSLEDKNTFKFFA